jgi:hypothetical protein
VRESIPPEPPVSDAELSGGAMILSAGILCCAFAMAIVVIVALAAQL